MVSKTAHIQTSFTGGESSPKLLARVDNEGYNNSVKTMLNALPFYHGGTKRRPGLFYVNSVRNSSFAVKLVPFIYSRTQSYVCVFNNSYIQFIKNGEFIESAPGVRYEIAHPYTSDELNEIRYAQFGNSVYFVHPNHPPKVLSRTSDVSWSFTNIAFIYRALTEYWYENANVRFKIIPTDPTVPYKSGQSFTITSPGGGGACTYTFNAAATTPATGLMVVSSKLGSPAETWTVTCVYADSLRQEWSVTGSVSGSMIVQWKTGNYPAAIAFYQQRLFLGGTPLQPQTVWGSVVSDFVNLTRGADDSDGVELTLASSSNDMILHLVGSPSNLLVMSYANEFVMDANGSVYTPKTAMVRPQTTHGCNLVSPLRIGHDVVFIQRDGRRVRSIAYDIEKSSNSARDLTVVSEHITSSGIIDMAYQQDPDAVVWMVRQDGKMVSLTYLDEQSVVAWAQHSTDGDFKAVCSIPENNSDRTYVVVERVINGVVKKYIESIDYLYSALTDCAAFGSSVTPKTSWTGLGHLEGKTVKVVGDGSMLQDRVVVGGAINVERAVSEIQIGLQYDVLVELLHPNPNVDGGTSQGRQMSVHEVVLRLYETIGCTVNGVDIPFTQVGDPMDQVPQPFTGDKMVKTTGWRTPNNLRIEHKLPHPFTLLGCVLKLVVTD